MIGNSTRVASAQGPHATRQPGFGLRLPVAGPLASAQAIERTAKLAESLDYDAVWVHDFIVWTREQDRTHVSCGAAEVVDTDDPPQFLESISNLSYLAGVTSHVKLGVGVLCIPYRQPVVTARQIATIDVLSGGRMILGVGPGGSRTGSGNRGFEVLGISRADKYSRTSDYVRAMKSIWCHDQSSHRGPYAAFPQDDFGPPTVEFFPKPTQEPHPPIWVSGWSKRGLELVAELGDGWLPGRVAPQEFPPRIDELHAIAETKGRSTPFTIGLEVSAAIDRSAQMARERARATAAAFKGFKVSSKDDQSPEDRFWEAGLIGSPEQVRDKLGRFVEAGVSHFEIRFIYRSLSELEEQMSLFMEEVATAVRAGNVNR